MGDMDKGRSIFDIRHRFVYSMIYELPFGQDFKGAARQAFHGWNVNTILQIQTGPPFGVGTSADPSMTGVRRGRRPDRICDGNLPPSERTLTRWFDTSCFVLPAPNTYGNAGVHYLDTDGISNVDLAVFKNIPITERWRLQLRGEAFNAFNYANFGRPTMGLESPAFGRVTTALDGRIIQIGAKLLW